MHLYIVPAPPYSTASPLSYPRLVHTLPIQVLLFLPLLAQKLPHPIQRIPVLLFLKELDDPLISLDNIFILPAVFPTLLKLRCYSVPLRLIHCKFYCMNQILQTPVLFIHIFIRCLVFLDTLVYEIQEILQFFSRTVLLHRPRLPAYIFFVSASAILNLAIARYPVHHSAASPAQNAYNAPQSFRGAPRQYAPWNRSPGLCKYVRLRCGRSGNTAVRPVSPSGLCTLSGFLDVSIYVPPDLFDCVIPSACIQYMVFVRQFHAIYALTYLCQAHSQRLILLH
nr:MAG TPA: hypothetical protein [Caudoviricetes sp.]DAI00667.1 MAG TPA: hypothetical protein [Caudoviricetes sp.]